MPHHDREPTTPPPAEAERPDPGSRTSRTIATTAAVIAALAVVLFQNVPPVLALFENHAPPANQQDPDPAADDQRDDVTPPSFVVEFTARAYTKLPRQAAGPTVIPQLEQQARTPADRIVIAVTAAELHGPDAAVERLRTLARDERTPAIVADDAAALARVYDEGPDALEPDARERLETRYGDFARLAFTSALPPGDPARTALRAGAGLPLVIILAALLLAAVAVVAGFVLLILAVIYVSLGRIRLTTPRATPGGSVYLETFAVFCVGFLAAQLVGLVVGLLAAPGSTAPIYTGLALQWSLLLVPLYPLLRGVSGRELARAVGLRRGRGVAREIGAAITAYLASLPLVLVAVAVSLLLVFGAEILRQQAGLDQAAPPPQAQLLELVGNADPLMIALIVGLATIWAPIVEEIIFRGALQRHLRGRIGRLAAVVLTAVTFGFFHGNGPLLVAPLIVLGLLFSLIREWRGTIIGCIAVHAVHNGFIVALVAAFFALAG